MLRFPVRAGHAAVHQHQVLFRNLFGDHEPEVEAVVDNLDDFFSSCLWKVDMLAQRTTITPQGPTLQSSHLWKLYLEDECGVVHKSRTQFVVGGERINFVKKEQQPVDFLMENDLCLKLK